MFSITTLFSENKIISRLRTPYGLFVLFFAVFFILRLIYILKPVMLQWDAAVYVGMGRYISSFGDVGRWESIRPPLLPILYSIGGFLHISLILWAKILTFFAGMGSLLLIYKIGEKIKPYAGTFAMIFLGVSTLFFGFANTMTTEIFGVFFSLLSLYFFLIKRNYFLTGIIVGLSFLLRFPYGLLFPIFGLGIIFFSFSEHIRFKDFSRRVFYYMCGFFVLAVPLFVSYYFLYGNAFTPFVEARAAISGFLWLYDQPFSFYPRILFYQNPIFFLAPIVFFFAFRIKESYVVRNIVLMFCAWSVIFFGYFIFETHNEARYIIPIFPALALLSGLSVVFLKEKFSWKFLSIIVCILSIITFSNIVLFTSSADETREMKKFYNSFQKYPNSWIITTSPIVAAYSPVSLIEGYDSWEHFYKVYIMRRNEADFVLVNTCELNACQPGSEALCQADKLKTLTEIMDKETIIYNKTINMCTRIIARINK